MATVQYTPTTPWTQEHPKIATFLHYLRVIFDYLVSGRWITDLVRWMLSTGGNIAESAFLLATVYVTVNVVAHPLVSWVLPNDVILSLNQISVIAFSVLPELIVAAAIKVTYDHWKMALSTKRIDAFVWAGAYTIPTAIFLGMTIATITGFVSLEAIDATATFQTTGAMLVTRCLAGWGYGMLQMLFSKIGNQGYSDVFTSLNQHVQALGNTLKNREASIATLENDIATLKEQFAIQRQELIDTRIALANHKVTRKQRHDITEIEDGNVTLSTTSDKNDMNHVISMKRQRVKERLHNAILDGEKLNLKKIAAEAGVSYGMVRKNAQTMIEEITNERQTEKIPVVS